MNFFSLLIVGLCLGTSAAAEQKFTASDGSYFFIASDGWQLRQSHLPIKPLLDLTRDNAAAVTIVREKAEELKGVTTTEVMKMKLEQFKANGMSISNETPITTRQIAGAESVEIEIDSTAHDKDGIAIKSRLILVLIRESDTSVLTSVASCRVGAKDLYLPQLRAILGSISKARTAI